EWLLFAGLAGALMLVGCGRGNAPVTQSTSMKTLSTLVIQPERIEVERKLDGLVEAVNQGTVAAQTSGRVAEILYDVNDFVPAGAVIIRLRSTEQRAGLLQAEAALREATAREAQAQTRYQRIA